MKAATINSVCESVKNKTLALVGENDSLKIRAGGIGDKFKTLNTLYSNVHASISHQRPTSENDIERVMGWLNW